MKILTIALLSAPGGEAGAQGGGGSQMLIMLGLILLVFYFFMIRPQMKKQKEVRKFRESIKAGDKVVTIGGIYGKVVEVKEANIVIEISKDVNIKVDKNAIIRDFAQVAQQQK